jgi:hypothetical protein
MAVYGLLLTLSAHVLEPQPQTHDPAVYIIHTRQLPVRYQVDHVMEQDVSHPEGIGFVLCIY